MGHLGRRDWSAGPPLKTPHPQLTERASLKPSQESGKMADWKDTCSSSFARTPKLQLAAEQSSTGECLIPPKKHIPHPRAKEKPQQDCRRGEVAFRIKPHTCQRSSEGSNKTLSTPGPRDPHGNWARLVFESPAELWVSSDLSLGQGLWG